MRVSKEQVAENRAKILESASKLIRERGILGVGVDAVSEAAGLTHGSVYSQFGSKDRLAAEAMSAALLENAVYFAQAKTFKNYVTRYLSDEHLNAPGRGCALAALGCEVARSSEAVRAGFTIGLRRMVDRLSRLIDTGRKQRRDDDAIVAVATMVGAVILSRAVDDPDLAERILQASRKSLTSTTEA